MAAPANSMTSFTGVLIRRQYQPGQKYIQLVFESTEGLKLSVSRNVQMVRGMIVGHTYLVNGKELSIGDKSYIYEPVAAAVTSQKNSSSRRKRLTITVCAIAVILGISAVVFALSGPKTDKQGAVTAQSNPQSQSLKTSTTQNKDANQAADAQKVSSSQNVVVPPKPVNQSAKQSSAASTAAPQTSTDTSNALAQTPVPDPAPDVVDQQPTTTDPTPTPDPTPPPDPVTDPAPSQ